VDPNNFQFSFGQPSQGPPPPNGPNGPFRQFKADLGNPAWAPWDNPNAAQQLGQGQPAAQQCIQPNLEEAPPLIPLQPMNGNDNEQPHDAIDDGLELPVEEVIQNNQELVDLPLVVEEQVLAMDDETDTDSEGFPQVQLPIPPVEIIPFPDFNNYSL